MIKRIIIAVLSSVLMIVLMTLSNIKQINTTHVYIYFHILLGYLLLGIPISFFIDLIICKHNYSSKIIKYLYSIFLYSFGGVIAFFILYFLLEKSFIVDYRFVLGGVIPSIIYYHVSILIKYFSMVNSKVND